MVAIWGHWETTWPAGWRFLLARRDEDPSLQAFPGTPTVREAQCLLPPSQPAGQIQCFGCRIFLKTNLNAGHGAGHVKILSSWTPRLHQSYTVGAANILGRILSIVWLRKVKDITKFPLDIKNRSFSNFFPAFCG